MKQAKLTFDVSLSGVVDVVVAKGPHIYWKLITRGVECCRTSIQGITLPVVCVLPFRPSQNFT